MYLVSMWFGIIMIILVVAGAIAFGFTDFMDDRLYGPKRSGFVVILLAYGVYRAFRLRALLRSQALNED